MTTELLFFFRDHMQALPLYETLEARILSLGNDITIRVSKTQITFARRYGFAFVSFLPVRPAAQRPPVWLTVTFGLGRRETSPRIDVSSEPYPDRWTHHLTLGTPEEVDDSLMAWIREAYEFASTKQRRRKRGSP